MPKVYGNAETVESIATRLIPTLHPELASSRIAYTFVDKASVKNGKSVPGKIRKVTGVLEFLLEKDFLIEVGLDVWNEYSETQRDALIDHLLERCVGEEDENDGTMHWSTREPDVQEFSSILRRHGAWNDDLQGFVSVAKDVDIDELVDEVVEGSEEADMESVMGDMTV
jgi:hypothetical protein